MDILKAIGESFKDVDTKQGIVMGYLSAFGNVDSDGDIIQKGAYSKTIQENGPQSKKPRIKHLLDHDTTKAIGVFSVLKEDDYGLYYESKAGSWSAGQDFLKMVNDGLITEHSVRIGVIKSTKSKDGETTTLTEVSLKEGSSLQCWGANSATPILGVKSVSDYLEYLTYCEEKFQHFLKHGSVTDETFLLIEQKVKSISEQIKAMTTKPSIDTLPDEQAIINEFKQHLKFL